MKKLALFDPYTPKFTQDMVDWWRGHDYEVRFDRYYDPEMVAWADVVWFDTCDNNLKSATNPSEALIADWQKEGKTVPWALQEHDLTNKKIIVRPIDIEVWYGHHAGVDWSVVDDCVFIADHIKDICLKDPGFAAATMKLHTIPCGISLDKYRFAKRKTGKKVAIVSEKWTSKGTDLILQIALKLTKIDPSYQFHWLGRWSDYDWEKAYFDDFIERNNLNFKFYEWVDSVDEFLEDKNYLLHASHKEAFSYATAEAMAKGIKPIIHHFFGADKIWPGMTWNSTDEAIQAVLSKKYDSESYRQYLVDIGYTSTRMMEQIEEVING